MHRVLYCLLPLAAAAAVPAQAQSAAWRVSEVSGDVRISEAGRTRAATRGALLSGGSVIAGARSRAVLVRGRQYVVVSPGSTVRVDGPAGGDGSIVEVAVEAGNALFKVDRRETPHFRVRTRYLAAVVRGTTFSVTVTPTGGTVQVTEGAVQVSTVDGGASDLIRPGMIARIGASDLYRLTISGDEERVIRSPAAPAGTVSTPAPQSGGAAARPMARIGAPVGEAPVRLRDATAGLVDGAPAINLALRGRGDDEADRNRGSGNDRDEREVHGLGRDGREDRVRDLERDGRNGRGNGRGDEDGKDKDKDRPDGGGGNGGGDRDDGGEDGKDKPKPDPDDGSPNRPPVDGDDPDRGGGNDGRDKPGKDDRDDRDDDDRDGRGKPGKDDGDDDDGGDDDGKDDQD
jgi:hypothetical protein